MIKILISACFLGENVRYDGKNNDLASKIINIWKEEGRLISICPEVAGGLSVPRLAAEIQGQHVINIEGTDVTQAFKQGAERALQSCQQHHIQYALLKEGSPSCGSQNIHDGTFQHRKTAGQGITTRLLTQHGIQVFNEHQIQQLVSIINPE